jgi:hypothetical protein
VLVHKTRRKSPTTAFAIAALSIVEPAGFSAERLDSGSRSSSITQQSRNALRYKVSHDDSRDGWPNRLTSGYGYQSTFGTARTQPWVAGWPRQVQMESVYTGALGAFFDCLAQPY